MTMKEYDKQVNRRLRRMAWRKYGWIVANPLTALVAIHIALAIAFTLLGWEDA